MSHTNPWRRYHELLERADSYTSTAHSLRAASDTPAQRASNLRDAQRCDEYSRRLRLQAEQYAQAIQRAGRV